MILSPESEAGDNVYEEVEKSFAGKGMARQSMAIRKERK